MIESFEAKSNPLYANVTVELKQISNVSAFSIYFQQSLGAKQEPTVSDDDILIPSKSKIYSSFSVHNTDEPAESTQKIRTVLFGYQNQLLQIVKIDGNQSVSQITVRQISSEWLFAVQVSTNPGRLDKVTITLLTVPLIFRASLITSKISRPTAN
jgi:hypothetical protein